MDEVTISKEVYEDLLRASRELDCLYSAGVDNWEGFEEAMDMLSEVYEDD